MSDDQAAIALRLKEAREYLGLSQQEVTDATGIPRSAVSLIEGGKRSVVAQELTALARLFQRSVAYFTGEEQVAYPADINMLARQASTLSEKDRSELLRFTEFLVQRSQPEEGGDDQT
jgi:transcriptional regulator with XRE-family HTH domain